MRKIKNSEKDTAGLLPLEFLESDYSPPKAPRLSPPCSKEHQEAADAVESKSQHSSADNSPPQQTSESEPPVSRNATSKSHQSEAAENSTERVKRFRERQKALDVGEVTFSAEKWVIAAIARLYPKLSRGEAITSLVKEELSRMEGKE